MFSFLKGLLSTNSIIDAGIKGLDAVVFTDEERSTYMLKYLEATAPMARSRRFIAIVITLLWTLGIIISGGLLFVDSEKFSLMSQFMTDTVNTPFSVIMGFYFLAHVISKSRV